MENTYGETVISRFDYANDELGRRISRADSGQAFANPGFDKYAYNTRSEVIGAQRYHGTDVSDTSKVYGGRGFGYNYDPIGNRTSASETIGGETLVKTYAANELNQYTSIANPVAVGLRGTATNTAVVTVNGDAATRDSVASNVRPWHFALPADNANGGKYTRASIMAVVNPSGTNTQDSVDSATGFVYAPPQNETPTYDDDGNLLSDGHWHYIWNGENRLIKAEEQVCPTNRTLRKVDYAYDHQGRMVWKKISHEDAKTQSWQEEKTTSYLWDDFNIIAETSVADSATNTTYNVWGLDLDGTLQGAVGVGGLLAVVKDSATYVPAWDANGNIMEYVSLDGTIAAHREYDPFGGTVVATGDVDVFTHWFSTKPWCPVTGLSEYQYRKYNPMMGRWMNRDPIGEIGGPNMFAFVGNNSLDYVDAFGDVQVKKDLIKKNERMTFNGRGIWGWTFEPEFDSERAAKLRYDKKSCECRVRRKPELKFIIKIWVVKSGRQNWTEEARFDGVVYPDCPVYVSGALASAVLEHENRRFDAWSDGLQSYFGREYEDKAASLTAPTCPELAVKIADLRSTAFEQWSSSTDAAAVVEKLLQIGMEHTGTARVEFDSWWRGVYVEYDLSE